MASLPHVTSRPGSLGRAAWVVVGLGLGSFGCSVATAEESASTERSSTQAVLRIQREELPDRTARGDALAGFIRLPASADRARTLRLAGLSSDFPPPGQCRERDASDATSSVSELGRIDLLDADGVELKIGDRDHELAPHAFPTVTDWIRGVVYTSRDRGAEHLTPGEVFRFVARSVEGTGDVEVVSASPPSLLDVTLAGQAWDEVEGVEWRPFLDVTWAPATPREATTTFDVVTVSVESERTSWSCSFLDVDGAGSVPLRVARADGDRDIVGVGEEARVSVHRVRETASQLSNEVDLLEVHFDFSVVTRLRFD